MLGVDYAPADSLGPTPNRSSGSKAEWPSGIRSPSAGAGGLNFPWLGLMRYVERQPCVLRVRGPGLQIPVDRVPSRGGSVVVVDGT